MIVHANQKIDWINVQDYIKEHAQNKELAKENVQLFKFPENSFFDLFYATLNLGPAFCMFFSFFKKVITLTIDLLLFLRCVHSGQKIAQKNPLSKEAELKVLQKYQEICLQIIKSFKSTLDVDQELLTKSADFKTKVIV